LDPYILLSPPSFLTSFFPRPLPHPLPTLFPYTTLFRSAARLPDLRDALFDVSQEVHTPPIARTAGPDAPAPGDLHAADAGPHGRDRKSTRLNSSHVSISYAVFCLKKKKKNKYCSKLS